jgi:hypothetical protein
MNSLLLFGMLYGPTNFLSKVKLSVENYVFVFVFCFLFLFFVDVVDKYPLLATFTQI